MSKEIKYFEEFINDEFINENLNINNFINENFEISEIVVPINLNNVNSNKKILNVNIFNCFNADDIQNIIWYGGEEYNTLYNSIEGYPYLNGRVYADEDEIEDYVDKNLKEFILLFYKVSNSSFPSILPKLTGNIEIDIKNVIEKIYKNILENKYKIEFDYKNGLVFSDEKNENYNIIAIPLLNNPNYYISASLDYRFIILESYENNFYISLFLLKKKNEKELNYTDIFCDNEKYLDIFANNILNI